MPSIQNLRYFSSRFCFQTEDVPKRGVSCPEAPRCVHQYTKVRNAIYSAIQRKNSNLIALPSNYRPLLALRPEKASGLCLPLPSAAKSTLSLLTCLCPSAVIPPMTTPGIGPPGATPFACVANGLLVACNGIVTALFGPPKSTAPLMFWFAAGIATSEPCTAAVVKGFDASVSFSAIVAGRLYRARMLFLSCRNGPAGWFKRGC